MTSTFRASYRSEPVRVGLIFNPYSRFNHKHDWLGKAKAMLGAHAVCSTTSVHEIDRALVYLLREQERTVLAIGGGDGTLHHVLNVLITRWLREREQHQGPLALPPVLILRGGTLNIVARALRVLGSPDRTLRLFLRRYRDCALASVPLISQAMLALSSSEQTRYGFIFGSEATARCLELYENRFGGGYTGLAWFLEEVARGYLMRTELWHQYKYLVEDAPGQAEVDGRSMPYRGLVASTVDIKLLGGLIQGMHVQSHMAQTMQVRVLGALSPAAFIRSLPRLVLGQQGTGIQDYPGTKEVRLCGDFSLDGEVFIHNPQDETPQPLQIQSPAWSVPLIGPFP